MNETVKLVLVAVAGLLLGVFFGAVYDTYSGSAAPPTN